MQSTSSHRANALCRNTDSEHVRKDGTNAAELQDLIQRVLLHPDFNTHDVGHHLHERLMRFIEDGDIEVINVGARG